MLMSKIMLACIFNFHQHTLVIPYMAMQILWTGVYEMEPTGVE